MKVDYLIIGAGVAGTTAAETIRARDERGSIVLVGDESHRLYSRVMLPMVVDGRIPEEKAYLKDDGWYGTNRIEYLRGRRISRVDGAARRAWLDDGTDIEFGKALIASGGRPRRMDVPGAHLLGIHRLQTYEDAIAIREALSPHPSLFQIGRGEIDQSLPSRGGKQGGPHAVIIGGGFIACEFINAFARSLAETTVCLRRPAFFGGKLDAHAVSIFEQHLTARGVRIMREEVPLTFLGEKQVSGVKLSGGTTIACSTVGIGIGLEPNIHFLENVQVSQRGVVVNEYLESSAADMYAAGDVAEFFDVHAGHSHVLGNWFNAREQGRIAGINMSGERTAYNQVSSYSITVLGMNVAFIGDLSPAEMITRGDGQTTHAQLFLRDGKLRGGIFINRIPDRKPALELIKAGKDVSNYQKDISNPAFDLNKLLA